MYTFLFVANFEEEMSEHFLRGCAKITKKWMPAFNIELTEEYCLFPESHSGWFSLTPPDLEDFTLISKVIDQRYAVIVFGDIFNNSPRTTAQTVYDAWVSGGCRKIRELEGCFSSVILDRSSREAALIGDMMGRRALSYYTDGHTLLVSPHDVVLAATGRIPLEFDEVSISSVVAVEWSLRGRSLLKQVQTCHPAEYVKWSDGKVQIFSDSFIDPDQRIIQGDDKAISRNLDHMLKIGQAHAEIFATNQPEEFRCDLSAGFDSRVTWSFLLSIIDKSSRIIATSCGEPNNVEVRVGSRLAKMYGTNFSSFVEAPPAPVDFVTHCDLLAFSMNGGTTSRRAMKYSTKFSKNPKTYACGAGGEIFRGFYYPHAPYFMPLKLSPTDALRILRKRTRIDKLPWKFPELSEAIHVRLKTLVDELAAFSNNGYDILDMYYLYERSAVWGAAQERQTWKEPRWSPFNSTKMIKTAFTMPAPIAKFSTIHHEAIRRFTPKAYWVRVNGKLLFLEGEGSIQHWLKKIDQEYQTNLHRIQRILNVGKTRSQNKDMDQLVHDFLAGPLMEPVHDILMAQDSFALNIFGRDGIESFLNEHKSRKKNHTEVLGLLVSMERWRTMIQGVTRDTDMI